MKKFTVNYKNNVIEYTIIRKKVKNINIKVRKNITVEVVANSFVTEKYIEELVLRKAEWILKSLNTIKSSNFLVEKNEYNNGDVVKFLGNEYKLKLIDSSVQKVEIVDSEIYMYTKYMNNVEKKEELIYKWYRERAFEHFNILLNKIYPLVLKYNIEKPYIKLRKMKSCWGTCHYRRGFIVLNTELIKYKQKSIEYVILHELVHFVHHNHSKDFYNTVDELMPDWRDGKSFLK